MIDQHRQLNIRPAQAHDRDAIFAMIATVWDGTDYIPEIWDEWLHASDGPLLVGTFDDKPVALVKLTSLGQHEDWLEGVRVDPEFRGQGLARSIVRHCIGLSRQRAKRRLRFQTSQQNPTMQRLADELGFRLVYAPDWYGAAPLLAPPTWQPLPESRLPEILADLAHSPLLSLTNNVYTYSWSAYDLSEERVREHWANGMIVGLPGERAWAAIDPSDRGGYWIALAEGSHHELTRLFRALRHTAEPSDAKVYARMHIPAETPLVPALLAAGFARDDHGAVIYEYVLQ